MHRMACPGFVRMLAESCVICQRGQPMPSQCTALPFCQSRNFTGSIYGTWDMPFCASLQSVVAQNRRRTLPKKEAEVHVGTHAITLTNALLAHHGFSAVLLLMISNSLLAQPSVLLGSWGIFIAHPLSSMQAFILTNLQECLSSLVSDHMHGLMGM